MLNKFKILFWVIWLVLLALVPITIFRNQPINSVLLMPSVLSHFIQRLLGLTAFVLLFWQVLLGSNMEWFTNRVGGWVFRFHIVEGVVIYTLVFLHPVMFLVFNYFQGKGFDPFYVFTQICVLCPNRLELYYTLGRVSFWLLTIAVFAGLFRAATPFMRANWRKFHVLNYLVFLIIGIHGLSIGTDFMTEPFFGFAIVAYLVVLYIVIIKKLPQLYMVLKNWWQV